jgi:hypothetical protein
MRERFQIDRLEWTIELDIPPGDTSSVKDEVKKKAKDAIRRFCGKLAENGFKKT